MPRGQLSNNMIPRAFEEVQNTLQAFVSTNAKIAQMYKKNIALAVLEIAFRLPQSLYPQSSDIAAAMPRVTQLCLFLDRNYDRASAFDDVKGYVSALSFEEANHLTTRMLPKMSEDVRNPGLITTPPILAVVEYSFTYSSLRTSRILNLSKESIHKCYS